MKSLFLYAKISRLPAELKAEVSNFVDFLLSKEISAGKKSKRKLGKRKREQLLSGKLNETSGDFKDYL